MSGRPSKTILEQNFGNSLFFKTGLFTIHDFFLLFIKKDIYSLFLGPYYSLIINFFAHYSLSLKNDHYSFKIIIPHPDPQKCIETHL